MLNSAMSFATMRTCFRGGDVAQLVRALPCHGRGRGFEPRRPRHSPDAAWHSGKNTSPFLMACPNPFLLL